MKTNHNETQLGSNKKIIINKNQESKIIEKNENVDINNKEIEQLEDHNNLKNHNYYGKNAKNGYYKNNNNSYNNSNNYNNNNYNNYNNNNSYYNSTERDYNEVYYENNNGYSTKKYKNYKNK